MQEFLQRRNGAARELGLAFQKTDLAQQMKLGAEVFYSSQLAEIDMRPLCLTGTSLLLIEFPPAYYPQEAPDVLYQLTRQGIVPLIAHVERYAFVRSNPNLLCDLIEAGAYTQMNATSLVLHKKHQNLLLSMIRHGMIHVLATDAHSIKKRPPMLGEAMVLVTEKCGEKNGTSDGEKCGSVVQRNATQSPGAAAYAPGIRALVVESFVKRRPDGVKRKVCF